MAFEFRSICEALCMYESSFVKHKETFIRKSAKHNQCSAGFI